ncbi:MAG: hypothetical protein ABEH81_01010 [Halopenitus sp.]
MAEDEDADSRLTQALERVPGSTRFFQDGDKVGVESDLRVNQEDAFGSPIAKSARDTRQELSEDEHDTVFDMYDALVDLDGELSGAVNAIAQSATYAEITMPTDDPTDTEEKILEECQALAERIRGKETAIDVLRNLIKHGNDINKKVYNDEVGIIALQSLPTNSVTIVDDRGELIEKDDAPGKDIEDIMFQVNETLDEGDEELGGHQVHESFERDAYVLNEEDPDRRSIIEPHNVLHFSIDARSNWFEDQLGRETYGVWGQSRLEPLKFTIQTKYNTLLNKVAMDDKLLAREVYYINTTELFGDISDREERIKKAEKYADDLKEMVEELGPDERPMLPEHVEVKVIGPEGKAIDQKPFIEQLNNGIAAALTFPMAGLGRGTTSVKAGEEISSLWAENNIKNLRNSVIWGLRELFKDHIKILHPELVENNSEAQNIGDMKLQDDIHIPTLKYEPFRQEDRTEIAGQIETLVNIGVMRRAEARDMWGLSTDDETMDKLEEEWNTFNDGGPGGLPDSSSDGEGQPPEEEEGESTEEGEEAPPDEEEGEEE